jgi:hypothetical protein
MVYENNFRVLDDRALVDPALAIFVTVGRVHEEEEGWWVLHISHDPDLKPNILTYATKWDEADKAQDSKKKSELGIRDFSDKKFSFFEFMVRKITEGDTIVWELLGSDEEFQRANLGSAQRNNLYDCQDRKSFLLYVFKNLLLLPELRRWGYRGYVKAQLRIPAAKFAHLTGQRIEDVRGDVIWDERDVEAAR